jgi:putative IMPACT (imprinted ancient) family translation regulator
MRFSDDHEPQGTAGLPVLDSLRKNEVVDAVVVVTRYFGGTLLGTGGLVRAYSAAAFGAVESAKIITYDVYRELIITVGYSDYQRLSPIFDEFGFRISDTAFTDSVEISGTVSLSFADLLEKKIVESTSGRAKIDRIGEKFDY